QQMGRAGEARAVLGRFGVVAAAKSDDSLKDETADHTPLPPRVPGYFGTTTALTLAALAWGFVNFGVLLWLPSSLVAEGRSVGLASTVIAKSTLFAAPAVVIVAYIYSAWSTKWSLATMIGIT